MCVSVSFIPHSQILFAGNDIPVLLFNWKNCEFWKACCIDVHFYIMTIKLSKGVWCYDKWEDVPGKRCVQLPSRFCFPYFCLDCNFWQTVNYSVIIYSYAVEDAWMFFVFVSVCLGWMRIINCQLFIHNTLVTVLFFGSN